MAKYTDKCKNIAFTMTNQAFAVRPEQNFKVRYLCGKHRSKGKVFAILTKINDNLTVRSSRQTLVSNWFVSKMNTCRIHMSCFAYKQTFWILRHSISSKILPLIGSMTY